MRLTAETGQVFSAKNFWEMRRFFGEFMILQAMPAEFALSKNGVYPTGRRFSDSSVAVCLLARLPGDVRTDIGSLAGHRRKGRYVCT
jgi:hypothetical protein